jgi:predicted TIM-barrel enzyme
MSRLLCRPADWPLQTSTGIGAADFEPLVYGGSVAEPADAECVPPQTTGIHGFYGASSLDASPSNEPLTDQT